MSACFGMQATPDSYCAAFTAFVRRISTPWLPSSYARLPHLLSGSSGLSAVSRFPSVQFQPFGFLRLDMSHFNASFSLKPLKFGYLLGLQATPVPFQASNSASGPPPILHPAPTHSHWCFWLSPDSYPDPHQIPSPCGSSGFVGHLRNS